MKTLQKKFLNRAIWSCALRSVTLAALIFSAGTACATPYLLVDADTGAVLSSEDASKPWYPASLTKLMTVYVALSAVRDGHISLQAPLKISLTANRMPPSKMGFRPGTEVTLDNALKMLMVKSANDIAVAIAEGISGSVDQFANEMNKQASKLGLVNSHFVNPNGLPNPQHVSSARDMAVLARALLQEFPDQTGLYDIGAIELDGTTIPTHNGLLGRYPGADGMKTGFTCAAGFNVVASATQNGRKLIVVVLGAKSAKIRTEKAASLFNAGFAGSSSGSQLDNLPAGSGLPPDMRPIACGKRSKTAILEAETEDLSAPIAQVQSFFSSAPPQPTNIAALPRPSFTPVPVFVGRASGWVGESLSASNPALKPLPATATAYVQEPVSTQDPASPLKIDPTSKPMILGKQLQTPPVKSKKMAQLAQKVAKTDKPLKNQPSKSWLLPPSRTSPPS
eukprot:gene2354-2391_t